MQDYKIRIPNVNLRQQILNKAYSLGYNWYDRVPPVALLGAASKLYLSDNSITYGESDFVFSNFGVPEISYQDFLRLGEIDVNNCKIRLIRQDLVSLNAKLTQLGVKGYANRNEYVQINNPVRDLWGPTLSTVQHPNAYSPDFMFIRDGRTVMVGSERYFNQLPEKELTVAQIMQLQPTINNTTTEQIMSGEVTLKCITAPQKAKNITVDRDYTGILIDSDDSQVDTLREATHFRCVNNNGIEAKYKLALFTTIAPPPPPKITQQQFLDELNILSDRVNITFHGDTLRVLDFGYSQLSDDGTTCSCGVHSSNGLDDLWDRIEDDGVQGTEIINNYDADELIDELFKAIVLARVANTSAGLVIFSTTEDSSLVCELMDWLAENQGGHGTDFFTNPNSGNQIKAWLIPKN